MGVGLGGRGGNKDNTGIFLSFRKQQKKFCRQILKFLADSAARGGTVLHKEVHQGGVVFGPSGGSFPPPSPTYAGKRRYVPVMIKCVPISFL